MLQLIKWKSQKSSKKTSRISPIKPKIFFSRSYRKVYDRPRDRKQKDHDFTDNIIKEKVDKHPKKIYRVAFLGSGEVGKTSIIDQFMSSEHADVYEDIEDEVLLEHPQVIGR